MENQKKENADDKLQEKFDEVYEILLKIAQIKARYYERDTNSVVNAVYVRLAENKTLWKHPAKMKGFLFKVVCNELNGRLRDQIKEKQNVNAVSLDSHDLDPISLEQLSPDEELEARGQASNFIQQLPEDLQSLAILLVDNYEPDESEKVICERLGISRSALYRRRQKLRAYEKRFLDGG